MGYVLDYLFGAAAFMPHGLCLLWRSDLVALHATSDLLIAGAYFSIPAVIFLFIRRRRDLELGWVLYLFVAFIFLCGTTHLAGLTTLWYPYYGLEGLIKALTALASVSTAVLLWPILPKALAVPSPSELRAATHRLAAEVGQRIRAEQALKDANLALERRVEERTRELEQANARLRQREAELERQSQLLNTIFETIEQGISVFDGDMRLLLWNARFPQYIDLPPEMLREGLPLREIFRYQARQGWLGEGEVEMLVERQWHKIIGGGLLTHERRHQHNGRIIDVLRYPFPLGGVVTTFTDVTERNAAEQMFRIAVEASPSGMIMVDQTGRVILANREIERLFGYDREELIDRSVDLLVPAALRGGHACHRQGFAAQPEKRAMGAGRELFGQRKDGSRFPIEIGLNPIDGPRGPLVLAAVIDITERTAAEEMFRLTVEASPSGMIMVDQTGRVILANREIERLFGYDREELIDRSVDLLVPAASRAEHARRRAAFAAQPERRGMGIGRELFGQRKDGSRFPIEIGLNPIEGPNGPVVLAVVIDIAERRQTENALARQTRELQRSNAELEQFAYVASHDLREPLRMVASYTELLAERYRGRLDERADKYINYAVDGAKRMQQLVDDLLSYSRVGSQGRPLQPTAAGPVARRVIGGMAATIEDSGAEIACGELPTVLADETQLGQLLQNLISNAIKFRAPDRAPRVRLDAAAQDGMWVFSVEDNGIGIEAQYADRIFQMFQRLHGRGKYEGSGIGLTIAKKIVERHGGRIWFTSQPGRGATFHFSLPAG